MLHRSFKPAKCKTSLKLATSRLKLLKNKKEVQVNQLKRDLALLLESGQEQTARIRVEHVVREEKMMGAYELLQIYCELIVARLPIIESQKNCPIDLKEAITSVIFASPRCSDITELLDIRKHFTAKYGKEFITAATELRPDCGVNRTLVEKLSAVAPDGQTKIKILTAIAEEHNIKWDPNSFGEKDSKHPDDLLNGPNNFKASEMHAETPNAQAPNVQPPPRHDRKDDPPINSFEQNPISLPSIRNFASTDTSGTKPTMSTIHSPEVGPSGTEAERREVGQSFSENMNAFRPGRQNWNMEFKDATSAAQAAAESAERASMAARAAAELASRRDGGPGRYEHIAKDSVNSTSYGRNSKLPNEQIDGEKQNNLVGPVEKFYEDSRGSTRRSNRSDSGKSSKASIGDDSFETIPGKGYSRTNLSEEKAVNANEGVLFAECMKKQSGESEVEIVSDRQDSFKSQNFDYYVEERITKHSSRVSSHSHSSTSSGDYNVPDSRGQKFGNNAGEDPFVGVNEDNIHRGTVQTSTPDHDTIVFDDHGSDHDDYKFDVEPKYDEEAKLYFPSPGRESPDPPSPHADSWNAKEDLIGSLEKSPSQAQISTDRPPSPEFSENLSKSAEPSESDNKISITFDHSDGPTSESEDELMSSESGKELKFGTLTGGFRNKGYTHPPYTKKVAEDTFSTIDQPTASYPVKGSSSSGESTNVSSISSSKAPAKNYDSDPDSESDSDLEEEFPKKTLSSKQEPLNQKARKEVNTKSRLRVPVTYFDDDENDSKEDVEKQTLSSKQEPLNQKARKEVNTKSRLRVPVTYFDDDEDDSKEDVEKQTLSSKQEPLDQKARKEVNTKSRLRVPVTYFDDDEDDSKEDVEKQTFNSKGRVGSGFSRRTKISPASSEKSSYSRVTTGSKESGNSNSGSDRIFSRTSYGTEMLGQMGSSEQSKSNKPAASKPFRESKIPQHKENSESAAVERPPSPPREPVTEASSSVNTVKKASHVHPKLPDFDTIAAQFQSRRSDLQ